MTMKLYGFWRSLATYRVRAALALKGIEVEQVSIDLLQGKQHAEEYKAINPQSVVPALDVEGPGGAGSASRQGKGNGPLLPWRFADSRRRLSGVPGFWREVFQRRHGGRAHGHAHFRGMHENRGLRPLSATQAARRTEEPDPLNRDQGGIPWHSPAGVSSKRPGSAPPRWASPPSSGGKADRSESA